MATFFLEKKQAGGCLLKHTYTPGGYKIQGGKILPSLVFSFSFSFWLGEKQTK
jgi:hypothetical protein